jgi:ABC-2 type transport system permease protein
MRHALLDQRAPTAWEAIGGAERLAVPAGIVVAACLIGWWVFRREAPRIAENL